MKLIPKPTHIRSLIAMIGLCALSSAGQAQVSTSGPFVPVYVADQDSITAEMLDYELDQFVQNGKAIAAQQLAPQLKRNYEDAVVEAQRAEKLYETKSISLEKVREAQTTRDSAKFSMELNTAAEIASRMRAEVAKFKILEDGRANSYVLLDATVAQVKYLEALQILYKKAKEKADAQYRLAVFLEENGRQLVDTGAMPRQEYEQRVLARDRAETSVRTALTELEALTPALTAARRTLQRVQATPR